MTTSPFTTTSGDYLGVLLSLWLPRYGWTIVVPILVFIAIGLVWNDERFLLIALMLLFIVVPMLMSFLYTYYMLTPEARRSVVRKTVEIEEGIGLRLNYMSSENPESRPEALLPDAEGWHKKKSDEVGMPDARHVNMCAALPPDEDIPWAQVLRVKYTSRFLVYVLKGRRLQFLLVPYSALPRKMGC